MFMPGWLCETLALPAQASGVSLRTARLHTRQLTAAGLLEQVKGIRHDGFIGDC
ncbi:hypothetical protein [Belnapia moabensis]|uniref:hypothetical protein n=1 Tax=Belnapia moabensis TaxID=365533 RepID=UPI00146FE66B|nr:hypothetical protein [Belnapia moabensis]